MNKLDRLDRPDLYFSYWIIFWILLSISFKNIQFPFFGSVFALLFQYFYLIKYSCEIFNNKYYVIFGNVTMVIVKYLLLLYGLLFHIKNYNIINDIIIGFIVFLVFNIYYYINIGDIYYVFKLEEVNIPVESGLPCRIYEKLFELLG
tara:strand:- start:1458 stop:1898 length:441 start_codon:yes stop_codon:yes gene_type:complete